MNIEKGLEVKAPREPVRTIAFRLPPVALASDHVRRVYIALEPSEDFDERHAGR